MSPFKMIAGTLLALAALSGLVESAAAHSRSKIGGNTSGIPIANLSHGQLEVMSRYRAEILDLAGRQPHPDLETRTLANYVNLQRVYCLWGLVPGSLAEEDNPFNECSHSYLAGSKALLDHLRQTPGVANAARALHEKINTEMLLNASALQMCRNGVAPFNTAEIIMPEWRGVPFNPITGLSGFAALAAFGGIVIGGRVSRRIKPSTA